ncbi:MAG: hypothetical protein NVS1B11_23890 [Terriglobales bacterium]
MSSSRCRFAGFFLLLFFVFGCFQSASALPAFARKYGLRCSACHEAWPKLNDFGWRFKDNGYQLMNDRDAPIWQNPGYWPVTFRITPNWHRETVNRNAIDTPTGMNNAEQSTAATGFDITGLDFHTGGTLEKNISFYVLPSSDATGAFHFETVMGRFDNLGGSPWLNVKLGKFELDNMISEKRILTISNNGGLYHIYHFVPAGDTNIFGQMGDNQLGLEWMGHSANDRTRISAALLSSNDGQPGLASANAYSGFFAASQAFDLGGLGLQRVGAYAFIGQAPTYSLNSAGSPIAGGGIGNKGFSREGLFALIYVKKLDFSLFYQHGSDSAYFGSATASNLPLPAGARSPTWNGAFVETHYTYSPQLIFIQRSEWIRMSQQSIPGTPSNLGDIDAYTFGYRYYPIMTSRAGFAWHNEYSWVRQRGTSPVSASDYKASSLMGGFDFDF